MKTDLIVLRELEHLTQTRSVCTLSTRQLAELTGITQKTVVRVLSRLATAGYIVRTKKACGNHPAHWKVIQDRNQVGARNTSRSDQDSGTGMPDLFRRRDLQGPGALYFDLPEIGYFSTEQALGYTRLTGRVRTVEHWLMVLSSQKWPMVDEVIFSDGSVQWAKNRLQGWQLQQNADHLNGVAVATGDRPLKTRQMMELGHQLERASVVRMFPLATKAVAA